MPPTVDGAIKVIDLTIVPDSPPPPSFTTPLFAELKIMNSAVYPSRLTGIDNPFPIMKGKVVQVTPRHTTAKGDPIFTAQVCGPDGRVMTVSTAFANRPAIRQAGDIPGRLT